MYKLIVMSFDGDYKTELGYERKGFKTIEDAWEYSNDMGSKWHFYPFHFVCTDKTVIDTFNLPSLKGKRISTVKKIFASLNIPNGTLEDYCYAIEFGEFTKVIFRMFKGECIALFPELAGNGPSTCLSYQHVGQHGHAQLLGRPAKPEEYKDLKAELEQIGYHLTIAHRFTRKDFQRRYEQCKL